MEKPSGPLEKPVEVDVAIIGGGIIGTSIARELSKYKIETILIEKHELSDGQTRGTLGLIYAGIIMLGSMVLKSVLAPGEPLYDSNSLRWKLALKGHYMWFPIFNQLDIDYELNRGLIIATNKEELKQLDEIHELATDADIYGMDHRYIEPDEIYELEPAVTRNVIRGLVDEGKALRMWPPGVAFALAENAQQNGVKIIEDTEVEGIDKVGGSQIIHTKKGDIKADFVINAAGRFADDIAKMGGYCDWRIYLVRCPLIIMDKSLPRINGIVQIPSTPGRLTVLSPTNDGNILIDVGEYDKIYEKSALATSRKTLAYALEGAHRLVPSITPNGVIRSFGGLRAFNERDLEENIIEFPPDNPRFLNCAIRLPGIIQAPAVAEYVVHLLGNAGLKLTEKMDFNPFRHQIAPFRKLSDFHKNQLIRKDPRFGNVVCRCETITEGEICEAIRRGAHSVDGVKQRVRAGMGRCQGGFCGPRVVKILARELGIPEEKVRFRQEGTYVIPYKSKELFR